MNAVDVQAALGELMAELDKIMTSEEYALSQTKLGKLLAGEDE